MRRFGIDRRGSATGAGGERTGRGGETKGVGGRVAVDTVEP